MTVRLTKALNSVSWAKARCHGKLIRRINRKNGFNIFMFLHTLGVITNPYPWLVFLSPSLSASSTSPALHSLEHSEFSRHLLWIFLFVLPPVALPVVVPAGSPADLVPAGLVDDDDPDLGHRHSPIRHFRQDRVDQFLSPAHGAALVWFSILHLLAAPILYDHSQRPGR